MIDKARANAEKLGYNNVEFRQGDIEKIPITANVADVINEQLCAQSGAQ